MKQCLNCNKQMTKPKWSDKGCHYSKKMWAERKFCSKVCDTAHKKANHVSSVVQRSCSQCSKTFVVKNYRKDIAKFCSQDCSSKFRDEGKRTADKRVRQSWGYKKWRTAVYRIASVQEA